jgi:hypothetical protein
LIATYDFLALALAMVDQVPDCPSHRTPAPPTQTSPVPLTQTESRSRVSGRVWLLSGMGRRNPVTAPQCAPSHDSSVPPEPAA